MCEYTEKEWREHTGSGGLVMDHTWLTNGCPKCGCKTWHITNDYWAYCEDCGKGYQTVSILTSAPLAILNPDGSVNPVTFGEDDE